jgi:hypothetical protein
VLTHESQDVVEGFDEVDAHIGGDELHRRCYDALQGSWLEYTRGYQIPIENTTLRGVQIHAPIAGKALREPARPRDAIWHFVCKTRGATSEPKFKAEQVELAVVISDSDFKKAEDKREGRVTEDFTQRESWSTDPTSFSTQETRNDGPLVSNRTCIS